MKTFYGLTFDQGKCETLEGAWEGPYHFAVCWSCDQTLDGEVCDAMKGQRHQLRSQVVLVDVSQQSLMGEAEDGLDEMTAGRILQEHQQRTEGETHVMSITTATRWPVIIIIILFLTWLQEPSWATSGIPWCPWSAACTEWASSCEWRSAASEERRWSSGWSRTLRIHTTDEEQQHHTHVWRRLDVQIVTVHVFHQTVGQMLQLPPERDGNLEIQHLRFGFFGLFAWKHKQIKPK